MARHEVYATQVILICQWIYRLVGFEAGSLRETVIELTDLAGRESQRLLEMASADRNWMMNSITPENCGIGDRYS